MLSKKNSIRLMILIALTMAFLSIAVSAATFNADKFPKRAAGTLERLRKRGEFDPLKQAVEMLSPMANFTQTAKVAASDGSERDWFGHKVAISGDTAIIGAIFDDVGLATDRGSAYIFVRSGNGWSLQAKLVASDGSINERFGIDVAIEGNTAVVGSYFDNIGSNQLQGSVYVFTRSGATWTQTQKLIASDGAEGDEFGNSVAISGNTIVVGAFEDFITSKSQGSAYVFVNNNGTWIQQQKIYLTDGYFQDYFGCNVDVVGDTLLISSPFHKINFQSEGAAFVYVRANGVWTQQAQLLPNDVSTSDDAFGWESALDGNTIIVGAPDNDQGTSPGSAYIFVRNGTTWSQQRKLTALEGAAYDKFGTAVAIENDTVVVGSSFDNNGLALRQGSAYVYVRNSALWVQTQKILANDGGADDYFGGAVAISGSRLLVGAYLDDVSGLDSGSAYFFDTLAPTAAGVLISGRILTADGRGIGSARVILTDASGETRTAISNAFGYYRFTDVPAGETYILSVSAKRYVLENPTRVLSVGEDLTDVDFIAGIGPKMVDSYLTR